MYTIGQVAKLVHLPISTIRYYDKEGLFPTLERTSKYVDVKRTGQTHVYRFSRLVRAVDGSEAQPKLMVDSPSALDWNPCRDIARQAITARLLVGECFNFTIFY